MRTLTRRLLACFALALLTAPASARTNFVFILADDLGQRDLGSYGSTFHETPHLDALAAGGLRFANGYAACNVCSPTRAAILTGRYPARVGITDWIPGRPDRKDQKLRRAPLLNQLPLEEVTIAEALKEAGYATAFVGKWHLGGPAFYPDKHGFDVNVGGCEKGSPPSYFSPYKLPTLADGPQGEYLTDRLAEEACKFIDANKDKPFCVFLWHYAVHNPLQAKPEVVERFKRKANDLPAAPEPLAEGRVKVNQAQKHPTYAANLFHLDESVGRVMAKLRELKLDGDTVVVFTSDNGGLSTAEGSPTTNAPLRAGKGWNYEGGVRVPLIVHWPAAIRGGRVEETPAISTDFFPTFLEAAGQPPRPQQHADGVSLLPLFKGERLAERPLYWHYPHYSNQFGRPGGAIRAGDLKLVEHFEDASVELFNLRDDSSERTNLAGARPDQAEAMREQLQAWRTSVGAKMPTANPDYRATGD